MGQHPLDREMGLPGIGGPEHGRDPGPAGTLVAIDWRRK
jgi:hypothetical protein